MSSLTESKAELVNIPRVPFSPMLEGFTRRRSIIHMAVNCCVLSMDLDLCAMTYTTCKNTDSIDLYYYHEEIQTHRDTFLVYKMQESSSERKISVPHKLT